MNSISTIQITTQRHSLSNPISYFVEEIISSNPSDSDIDLLSDDIMNEEDENGNSPLIFASLEGKDEIARSLIDQGCFINHQNHNGETALYWACFNGRKEVIELLIESGANMNICNLDGASPSHVAAANGHISALRVLHSSGCYINQLDDYNESSLFYAVREGRVETVEFLVKECKARIDIRNEDEETPLELAQCLESCNGNYPRIIQILMESHNNNSSNSSSNSNAKYSTILSSPFNDSESKKIGNENRFPFSNTSNFAIFWSRFLPLNNSTIIKYYIPKYFLLLNSNQNLYIADNIIKKDYGWTIIRR